MKPGVEVHLIWMAIHEVNSNSDSYTCKCVTSVCLMALVMTTSHSRGS